MTKFLCSILIPLFTGVAAHVLGRPFTLSGHYSKRMSDLMRYGIGTGLLDTLVIVFTPKRIRLTVTKLITRVSIFLGLGVLLGFFITDED